MMMLRLFHRYFGLTFTWIIFFIFFSGTLAYYKDDITLFMQPEYYKINYKNSEYLDTSLQYLKEHHPNSDIWRITPPSEFTPYITISWHDDVRVREHRRNRKIVKIDPDTSEIIRGRSTYGGGFLSALHYDLWFINRVTAREIIGYITVAMLFVLLSGIMIHKRILKDFFKFRQKSFWMDSHILASVSGFVIFLMLSVSGLYLVERFMLKGIYSEVANQNKASMQQDFTAKAKARNEERKRQRALAKAMAEQNLTIKKDDEVSKNLVKQNVKSNDMKPLVMQNLSQNKEINITEQSLSKMRDQFGKSKEFMANMMARKAKFMPATDQIKSIVDKHSNENFESIVIQRSMQGTAHIQLNFVPSKPFTEKGLSFEAKVFDAVSGEKLEEVFEREVPRANLVMLFMRIFHVGGFGGELVRFVFFVFGCLGLIMCASGAYLWSQKQHSKVAIYMIKVFNNAFFIGLFTALGIYLLANQLIPYENEFRYEYEVYAFFTAFAFISLIGAIFVKKYGYSLSSVITSVIFAVVFIVSIANGSFVNFEIFKISLACLFVSLVFVWLSLRFIKEKA